MDSMIADLKKYANIKMPSGVVEPIVEIKPRKKKTVSADNNKSHTGPTVDTVTTDTATKQPLSHEEIAAHVMPPLFPIREGGKLLVNTHDASLTLRCTEGHIHRYSFHDITCTEVRCITCTTGTKPIRSIREIVETAFDTGFSYVRSEPQYYMFDCNQYPITLFITKSEHKTWRPVQTTTMRTNITIPESKGVRGIGIILHGECKELLAKNTVTGMLPEKVVTRIESLIPLKKNPIAKPKSKHTQSIYFENCQEFVPK